MFSKILTGILGETHKSDIDLSYPWTTRAPKMQRELLKVVKDFQSLKPPAGYSYEMFAAKKALEQNKQFALTLHNGLVVDWVGIEIRKQTAPSGDTDLLIMIGDEGTPIFVGNSRIKHPIGIDSAMFDVIARTRVRTPVIFSGQLVDEPNGHHIFLRNAK